MCSHEFQFPFFLLLIYVNMLLIPEVNTLAGCVVVITFVVLSMAWHNIQAQLVLLQPG
jgi:hypothetical protein